MNFFGSAEDVLFLAVLVAVYFLGVSINQECQEVIESFSGAIKGIAMIVFIVGGGGAFKQVKHDTGVGDYIADLMQNTKHILPLIMALVHNYIIRVATGKMVLAITAAGIVGRLLVLSM